MTFHMHMFAAGSLVTSQILNIGYHETPLWAKQTHAQQLEGLLANMTRLTLRQHQRHAAGVETSVQKASLPEQIDHCDERPSTRICTGTSVDRYQDHRKYIVSIDGQLKGL